MNAAKGTSELEYAYIDTSPCLALENIRVGSSLAVCSKEQGPSFFVEFLPVRLKTVLIDTRDVVPTDILLDIQITKCMTYKLSLDGAEHVPNTFVNKPSCV